MTNSKVLELNENGYCVLRAHFPQNLIEACKEAFWPVLLTHLKIQQPNRGPHRHYLPMPFEKPCFAPEFFFDPDILAVICGAMGQRVVADQWGCDVPVRGSEYQNLHIDYQRLLFEEVPDLSLPPYMLVVSFGLAAITPVDGPIEIATGTHRLSREAPLLSVECGASTLCSVPLNVGDVLIRHPWALHRGTPNTTDKPRALATIRYVRPWYSDDSREVNAIPRAVWESLTPEQRATMRFLIRNRVSAHRHKKAACGKPTECRARPDSMLEIGWCLCPLMVSLSQPIERAHGSAAISDENRSRTAST